jgi:hypothetical protein
MRGSMRTTTKTMMRGEMRMRRRRSWTSGTMQKMGTKSCRHPYRGAPSCLHLVCHHAHHQHPHLRAARILRERGEGEEPQTPVPYLYEWEATLVPYSEAVQEKEREGEQVGGKRKR